MTIYSPSGAVVYEAPITKSAVIKRELMGDYYIELVFDAVDHIDVGRGCYILYNNLRFEIMSNVIPDKTNQGGLHYTLRFESQQSQMKRCNVFWRDGENLEVSFALTSEISTFGQLIIDNVNAFLGGSHFSLGSVPSGTEMKTISFAGDSCWDAVATIAETFGVEWWTEENGDKVRLCFGKLEIGESIEFKEGDIVSSMPSKKGDDANYGTRFYVFGSTKNLPSDYGSTEVGGITNNVVEKRLHLPDGQQYIDAWPNLASEDIVERTVFFDDVMPTNVETITEVYGGNAEVIPGTSHKIYDVVCANSPFSVDDIIEGQTIQANFTSGSLIGQTFDIKFYPTSGEFNKRFGIVPKILDKDSLTILPQGEMIPRVGDTFILLNVNLPKERVTEAEQQLLEVGKDYVKKNSSDTEVYDCPTNAVYCHENNSNFVLGQRVTLVGEQFGASGRESRIQGYEKKLYDEFQATYTVGDNSPYSRLASLEKAIKKSSYGDRVGLEANIIRSKNDSTIPSDYNVYSALMAEKLFFSREGGGIVKGHTNFENGISMYGIPFGYDPKTKSWLLEGNLIVTGGGAFRAALGDLDVPTIMDAVVADEQSISNTGKTLKVLWSNLPIDDKTIKRNADGTLSAIGGSGGGGSAEVTYDSVISALGYTPLSTAGGSLNGNLWVSGSLFPSNIKYYGSGKMSWYNDESNYYIDCLNGVLKYQAYYGHQFLGGNVGIGVAYPSEKLQVLGNFLATGGITARYTSDRRLKHNIRPFRASEMLMSLGGVYQFEYIDSEVEENHIYGGSHIGLIYQNVVGSALNRMCYEREDGYGSLNYLEPSFISLIAGATMENTSEIEQLKKRVKQLEARV